MKRKQPKKTTALALNLDGCPLGTVLAPMQDPSPSTHPYFADWETPLAPWGGFNLESHLEVVAEDGRTVLAFNENTKGRVQERALVSRVADYRGRPFERPD